jgi:hypothetical protein
MAHVAEFDLRGPALPPARGVLTLTYEPGPGPTRSPAHRTSALLRLDYPALGRGTVLDRVRAARALRQLAEGFLDNLTQAAEQRSYAA